MIKNNISVHLFGFCCLLFIWGSLDGFSQSKLSSKSVSEKQIKTRLEGEILPPATADCFAGAYYRKAVSSKDYWLGIGGTVVLPTIIYDQTRPNPKKPGAYLDNASVYLGGTSDGQETDIGMTWEVIREEDGTVSKEHKAFRPFLRRTNHKSGQTSAYKNAPASKEYYWYPGETILISLELISDKKLKLTVEGAGKKYEDIFDADGYQEQFMAVYKRVNAIDQVSNEGKPVQPTAAKVIGAKWLDVYLFRKINSQIIKVPMHSKRFTSMECPAKSNFNITGSNDSKEAIDIFGSK
jgi:hypothetical protein